MGQTVRFQETLRRLAMIDEGFVEEQAGLGFGLDRTSALDPKTGALLRVAVSVAIGSPAVCLEWSTGRALAAGATEDEIADLLLAIAPVAGLGRVVCAAPEVAAALGYDVAAALEETDGYLTTVAKEAGMTTGGQPGHGWTTVLRRQPARIVDGRPRGGYTNAFEIICCECGDNPYLDYRQVSPGLQRIRGPYPVAAGVAAYEEHLLRHDARQAAHPGPADLDTCQKAGGTI